LKRLNALIGLIINGALPMQERYPLWMLSNGVWAETEYGVKYNKNKNINVDGDQEVDMKEFMWIKLRAQTI